ncbi:MAG: hypothetical protein Q9227_005570 [Pyrenula ochraceoflavens]
MSFIGNMIEKFAEKAEGSHNYDPESYSGGAPQVPPPWRSVWDERDQRWLFINEQTGERTFQSPNMRTEYYQGGLTSNQQSGYYQSNPTPAGDQYYEKNHDGLAYGAAGAAAGIAGGAFLMHEGEEARQDWDQDKARFENRIEDDVQNVENFPENAAGWTGRKVGEIEDIPQDIEQDYDRAKDGVENTFDNAIEDVVDAPENVAGWTGEKIGDIERISDNVDQAYDEGRDEGRYDDY